MAQASVPPIFNDDQPVLPILFGQFQSLALHLTVTLFLCRP
jgi:hypothetical protein